MKHPIKLIIKFLFRGIAWGCTFFVFFCLLTFYWQGKDFLFAILEYYPKHAVGSMLVGIGYGSTAIVYVWERPSLLTKAGIHFFVGTGIFYCVAFYLTWIPPQPNRYLILEFLVSCVTFAVIWSVFYLFNRKEARTINDRLKELTKSNF